MIRIKIQEFVNDLRGLINCRNPDSHTEALWHNATKFRLIVDVKLFESTPVDYQPDHRVCCE